MIDHDWRTSAHKAPTSIRPRAVAARAVRDAREAVRRFIEAAKAEIIVYVEELLNDQPTAYAWGGKHLGPEDEIVITHLEHHANIVPWQLISQQTGAVLKVAPVDGDAGNLLPSS